MVGRSVHEEKSHYTPQAPCEVRRDPAMPYEVHTVRALTPHCHHTNFVSSALQRGLDRALSRALCFPNGPSEEDVSGLAMEQLSNEPTQSSAAQPQENHMGLANMPLVPLSEPPSATGLNGSQDSSQKELQDSPRLSSLASSPRVLPLKAVAKAVNDLDMKTQLKAIAAVNAMADQVKAMADQVKAMADQVAESHKAMAEAHKAMAEAQATAEAQRHADSENLVVAITNLANTKLADKHTKEASEDRAPSNAEKASEERAKHAEKASEERAELLKKVEEGLAKLERALLIEVKKNQNALKTEQQAEHKKTREVVKEMACNLRSKQRELQDKQREMERNFRSKQRELEDNFRSKHRELEDTVAVHEEKREELEDELNEFEGKLKGEIDLLHKLRGNTHAVISVVAAQNARVLEDLFSTVK